MGNIVEPKYIQSLNEKPLTYEEMIKNFQGNGKAMQDARRQSAENDFFTEGDKVVNPKKKRITPGRLITIFLLLIGLSLFGVGAYFVTSAKAIANISSVTGEDNKDIFSGLFKSITKPVGTLAGQNEGRTNILLIGADSAGKLADTIQILSYDYNSKSFTSYTIPRDLRVRVGGQDVKINESYAYAEQAQERSGPTRLANLFESEWGVKIHYWIEVNFDAVQDFINDIGGITINVPNGFTDCKFPKMDYDGYMPCQTFNAGIQEMDGKTALIYSRSRYGNNGEGSDFKRSERQQLVVQAILDKVKKDGGKQLFTFGKITNYLDTLGKNVRISLKSSELKSFYEGFIKQLVESNGNIERINLVADDKYFTSANYGGYYIIYADGTFPGASSGSSSRNDVKKLFKLKNNTGGGISWGEKSVIVLGNGSEKLKDVIKKLPDTGLNFCDTCYNNIYSYAKPAVAEKITIYIEDDETRNAFKSAMQGKFPFDYTLEKTLPANRVLTANNKGTDIIIWIE